MFGKDDATYTHNDINDMSATLRIHYEPRKTWWDIIRSIFSTMICKECNMMFIFRKHPGSWVGYKCPHCMESAGEYIDKVDFTQAYTDYIYENHRYITEFMTRSISQAQVEIKILQAVSRT